MKKQLLHLLLLVFICSTVRAQNFGVTGIYTDYLNFWASSSTQLNPVKPVNRHSLLAFTWNGVTFSTGVNDQKLVDKGVAFVAKDFRAFPIGSVSTASDTYIALGQLQDGVHDGASVPAPFPTPATPAMLASFLTDGVRGLDIGTGVSNIASGFLRFKLSSIGISPGAIDDAVPDVVVTQIAAPHSTLVDYIYFVDAGGQQVGNKLAINHNVVPISGNWIGDFYFPSGAMSTVKNSPKDFRLWAADLTSFGINQSNVATAVELVYQMTGASDVAFVAFNVPSISVATRLEITTPPAATIAPACCNNIGSTPLSQSPVIQVRDASGNNILQAGLIVTAEIASGPAGHGPLSGTVTASTNSNGQATFSNLILPCEEGNYTLIFTSSIIEPATSNVITVARSQYFVKPGSENALSSLSSWSSSIDGSGSQPANFGTGNVFNINNTVSPTFQTGGNWVINGQLNIPAGKTLKISANTTLTASCDINNLGNVTAETASDFVLNGIATQTLGGSVQLVNLTTQNTAGIHITAATTISGTLNLVSGPVNLSNSLTLAGAITRTAGVMNATAPASEIIFGGSSMQQLSASSIGVSVANLTVNNAGGVNLTSAITVTNRLRLTLGPIRLANYNLNAATIDGGSSTSFVRTNGSGRLISTVAGSGGSTLYPVGNTIYDPVTITNNNATADQFSAGVVDEMYADASSGAALTQSRIKASWNIQKAGANTGAGIALTMGWDAAQNISVVTPSFYAYNGGWAKQTTGTQSFPTTTSYSYAGYTGSAEWFGILDNAMLLPMDLKLFTASIENAQVKLKWQTASEQQSHEFVVMSSSDGNTWSEIGRVAAAGNSATTLSYKYTDATPGAGTQYYRLKQVDLDGRFILSDIRTVKLAAKKGFSVIGNPVTTGSFTLNVEAPDQLSLYDAAGKLIWRKSFTTGSHKIHTGGLKTGSYFIRSSHESVQLMITN